VRFGKEVVLAEPERDVEGARERLVCIFCHSPLNSKRRVPGKSRLKAMIYELRKSTWTDY
jgi:hypothetical protein